MDKSEIHPEGPGELSPGLPLRSRLPGPIADLGLLRRSLLFAELSYAAYMTRIDAGRVAAQIGLPEVRFYDEAGAQAYIFANDHDAVVACRGTEPHEWSDIRADLDAVVAVTEAAGRVHRGFKTEVDRLWPRLEQALVSNRKPLWFTGHSLGGAMAAICAGRCKLSYIESNPQSLITFGSPRVGDKRYVNHVRMEYYRWVNNNDIVARVPPAWMGYRHAGVELYLDNRHRLRRMSGWRRLRDQFRGFYRSLLKFRVDHFADHNLGEYINGIWGEVEREERLAFHRATGPLPGGRPPVELRPHLGAPPHDPANRQMTPQ